MALFWTETSVSPRKKTKSRIRLVIQQVPSYDLCFAAVRTEGSFGVDRRRGVREFDSETQAVRLGTVQRVESIGLGTFCAGFERSAAHSEYY